MVSSLAHPFMRIGSSTLWGGLLTLALLTLIQTHHLTERVLRSNVDFSLHNHDLLRVPSFQKGVQKKEPPSLFGSGFTPVLLPDVSNANATIVVQLSGEMGNNLHKLAFGRGLQLMAKEQHGLELNLVLRHQDHPKWLSAKLNLQKCFPNMRSLNFKAGNAEEYSNRQIQQTLLLGHAAQDLVLRGNDLDSMTKVLGSLNLILNSTRSTLADSEVQNIRLPFILADEMVDWHILDRYRPQLLDWLRFDYDACCPSDLPKEEESVFHYRNFVTELKGATSNLGFDELSADQTASELFGHLQPGDRVAITTRFDNEVTSTYVHAMTERGLEVRVLAGHSATEDFCFLAQAQKELVGGQRSSFFTWAAYLGLAKGIQSVRSYSVAASTFSPPTRNWQPQHLLQPRYDWKDPTIYQRWKFETY